MHPPEDAKELYDELAERYAPKMMRAPDAFFASFRKVAALVRRSWRRSHISCRSGA
jgi:chromosome condensin MukBEF MukE localization factor